MISCSLQDAGPVMINEALACGVPVISFKVGVANDIIFNKKNGFLLKKISHIELAKSIIKVRNLSNVQLLKMKIFCRKFSERKLNIDINTKNLLKFIYSEI